MPRTLARATDRSLPTDADPEIPRGRRTQDYKEKMRRTLVAALSALLLALIGAPPLARRDT